MFVTHKFGSIFSAFDNASPIMLNPLSTDHLFIGLVILSKEISFEKFLIHQCKLEHHLDIFQLSDSP